MKVATRDFGKMEIAEQDIITFKLPIFGFEGYSKFVFLCEEEISEHFIWLQSVEDEGLCFILVRPDIVLPNYCPDIPDNVKNELGEGDYGCWLMTVIGDDFKNSTVNLKSPIFVNTSKNTAVQIILEENLPIRFPLVHGVLGESQKEGGNLC